MSTLTLNDRLDLIADWEACLRREPWPDSVVRLMRGIVERHERGFRQCDVDVVFCNCILKSYLQQGEWCQEANDVCEALKVWQGGY